MNKATVFIVDDNEELLDALSLNLTAEGYQVKTFNDATHFLENYSPDALGCLLLDVRMPGLTGDALQDELIARNINTPIIFMSGYSDVPVAVDTLKKGAVDFLGKPVDHHTLVKAINRALQIDAKQRNKQEQSAEVQENYDSLTPREKEIMELIVAGKLSKVIADQLDIATNTVENHRASVMHKMKAKTVAELVCTALLNNLVDIDKIQ